MLALAFLFFFVMYLLISAGLAWVAAKLARKRGIKGWAWGLPVFVLMLGLIFWDWLPMEILYHHKCTTKAEYKKYKTLEEWKQENPGVAETLTPVENKSTKNGNTTRYQLNQRFAWDITATSHRFDIIEKDERLLDTKTGEILAKYLDYGTDIPPLGIGGSRLSDYKFWMQKRSCEKSGHKDNRKKFYQFEAVIENLGRNR